MTKPFLSFTNSLVANYLLNRESTLATDVASSGNMSLDAASNVRSFRMALCDAVSKQFLSFSGKVTDSHQSIINDLKKEQKNTEVLGVIDNQIFVKSGTFTFCLNDHGDTTILESEYDLSELRQAIYLFNFINEKEFVVASISTLTEESINTITFNFESISQQERDHNRLISKPTKVLDLHNKHTGFYLMPLGDSMNHCSRKDILVLLNPTTGTAITFTEKKSKFYGTLGALVHGFAIDNSSATN
ncbi:hypothetical protein LMH73_009815 [Vibrio splendidus]|nr:hypothetical protein [Vibrio splendidus]MCC4883034.1 hypothetical protein [Vibrio splendidus]